MTVLFPALAVAAFCVWLTVRIVNRREQWAKWTLAATIGVPILYVLSFGPACWAVGTGAFEARHAAFFFKPLATLTWNGPGWANAIRHSQVQTMGG